MNDFTDNTPTLPGTYPPDSPSIPLGFESSNPLVIAGKRFDGRSGPARRYRAVCAELINDLGRAPNSSEWIQIRHVAALSVQAELIEADILGGGGCDIDAFIKIVNAINRTLGCLKLRTRDGKGARVIDDSWAAAMEALKDG